MKRQLLFVSGLLIVIGLSACGGQKAEMANSGTSKPASPTHQPERWYIQAQVDRGNALYQTHCAECHKPDASGSQNWRTLNAEGKLPPPPLNGSAHTWHHPLSVLRRTVKIGGVPLGGSMPGFAEKLTPEQIDDILAWVQSRWSEEIYRTWHERDAQANSRLQSIKKG